MSEQWKPLLEAAKKAIIYICGFCNHLSSNWRCKECPYRPLKDEIKRLESEVSEKPKMDPPMCDKIDHLQSGCTPSSRIRKIEDIPWSEND